MAWQLIYTSAPRGLTPGQSGYCTVARSRGLAEGLGARLEKISYREPGGAPAAICAHRVVEWRGARHHVLTRVVDAGLDFTKRRSFLAHHLILEPAEAAGAPNPARIFMDWDGWRDAWTGEPTWLEGGVELGASERKGEDDGSARQTLTEGWVMGGDSFLAELDEALEKVGQPGRWGFTFTSAFQGGDDPRDFAIRAVWPGTAGFEIATRSVGGIGTLRELISQAEATPDVSPSSDIPGAPTAGPARVEATIPQAVKRQGQWLAIALIMAVAVVSAVVMRKRARDIPPVAGESRAEAAPTWEERRVELLAMLPDEPGWLVAMGNGEGGLGSIPPLENLGKQLLDLEAFAKDIQCRVQIHPGATEVPATVGAVLGERRLRCGVRGGPEWDLHFDGRVRSPFRGAATLTVEPKGGAPFRILAVAAPLEAPGEFLIIDGSAESVALDPALEKRLGKLALPPRAELALRPSMGGADLLAKVEDDFAIGAATAFDLGALRAQVRGIVEKKRGRLEEMKAEHAELGAEEKRLITTARGPEELKRQRRLAALGQAIPRAAEELQSLEGKAEVIPKSLGEIKRFGLFLCQSNVNTEVVRFAGEAGP